MESSVTPARIKIGTGCGCSEYSDQERAMLKDLLSLPRQMRFSVIHKALRVYCQALIASEGQGAGYPGTLDDVMRLMGVSGGRLNGSGALGGHQEAEIRHGDSVDRHADSDPESSEPVSRGTEAETSADLEAGASDPGRSSEPEPSSRSEPESEPEPEPDQHTEWVKNRMAQFMV